MTKNEAAEKLQSMGLAKAVEIFEKPVTNNWNESTIADIVWKFIKYESMSPKQEAFLRSLVAKVSAPAPAVAAPTGRVVVEGVVAKVDYRESRFGTVRKMLVRTGAGWSVWSTIPASVGNMSAIQGKQVKFQATLQQSGNDAMFAFASRPGALTVLGVANA